MSWHSEVADGNGGLKQGYIKDGMTLLTNQLLPGSVGWLSCSATEGESLAPGFLVCLSSHIQDSHSISKVLPTLGEKISSPQSNWENTQLGRQMAQEEAIWNLSESVGAEMWAGRRDQRRKDGISMR
jgi:hypothetical protein